MLSLSGFERNYAMGNVIAITSGKGGAGKSTFAVNIAAALAARGHETIVVDMNSGIRNLDIYMGLENKVLFDLGDVLTGLCDIEKAIIRDDRFVHLALLSSPQYKIISGVSADHVKLIVRRLREDFEYVVIDCPGGLDSSFVNAVSAADTALLIVTPDHVSMRNSDVVARRMEGLGLKNRFIAINMYDVELTAEGVLPDINQITKNFSFPLAGTIPLDASIHIANNTGCPIMCQGYAALPEAFMNIAMKLAQAK